MRTGPNLLKLARKEQCLALLTQLRNSYKIDGRIYRVFPSGEVQYLHPKVRSSCRQPTQSGTGISTSRGRSGRRTRAFEYSLAGDIWSFGATEVPGCCFLRLGGRSRCGVAFWSCFCAVGASGGGEAELLGEPLLQCRAGNAVCAAPGRSR